MFKQLLVRQFSSNSKNIFAENPKQIVHWISNSVIPVVNNSNHRHVCRIYDISKALEQLEKTGDELKVEKTKLETVIEEADKMDDFKNQRNKIILNKFRTYFSDS